jgi:hypothetical protein
MTLPDLSSATAQARSFYLSDVVGDEAKESQGRYSWLFATWWGKNELPIIIRLLMS